MATMLRSHDCSFSFTSYSYPKNSEYEYAYEYDVGSRNIPKISLPAQMRAGGYDFLRLE